MLFENVNFLTEKLSEIDIENYSWQSYRRFIIPYRVAIQLDPFSDSLFLFCGCISNCIKALFWEGEVVAQILEYAAWSSEFIYEDLNVLTMKYYDSDEVYKGLELTEIQT